MKTPTIHLNGSGRTILSEQYERADLAINDAINALFDARPNGRDYYTQGNEAYDVALSEHTARVRALVGVRTDISAIRLAIVDAD